MLYPTVMAKFVAGLAFLASVNADIYLQMPRGSNNRLDGEFRLVSFFYVCMCVFREHRYLQAFADNDN